MTHTEADRKKRYGIGIVLWGALLLWLVGMNVCQAKTADEVLQYFSENPAGRQELYQYAAEKLGTANVSADDKERAQRNLQCIANMAGRTAKDWLILVADNPICNAYALPGNIFVIHRGALNELTDEELQVILCHELAHQILGHPTAALKRSAMSMRYLKQAGRQEKAAAAYWEALQLSVVRKQEEKAADTWAAEFLAAHGFAMPVAISLWEKLRARYGEVSYNSNHLLYRQRIKIYQEIKGQS